MVISKRERLFLIVTLSVILVFLLDRYALTPFMEINERIQVEKQGLVTEIQQASRVFKQRKRIRNQWQEMVKGGLGSDASNTESKVLHVIREWSSGYGLTISSIKPDRNGGEGEILKEIIFNIACKGTMDAISRFLIALENSSLPVRITEFQLGSRETDGMDMSLQLRLSAVYLAEGVNTDTRDNSEVPDEEVKI
ncbi:hypothetical protein ACFL6W_04165 [Thermodesulfobacteriota bacterium]